MKHKWHKGPPPSIGWWPASVSKDPVVIRWWDGNYWSVPVYPNYSAKDAAHWAKFTTQNTNLICWTDPWWERT